MEELIRKIISGVLVSRIIKWINERKKAKSKDTDIFWKKSFMLLNISRLYEIPEFRLEAATMNPELVKAFYNVAIDVLLTCKVKEENIGYISRNFSMFCDHKALLASKLNDELHNFSRHDARYRLGFRSVYFILDDNIDEIEITYIEKILGELKPFFDHYAHPELLNRYALKSA